MHFTRVQWGRRGHGVWSRRTNHSSGGEGGRTRDSTETMQTNWRSLDGFPTQRSRDAPQMNPKKSWVTLVGTKPAILQSEVDHSTPGSQPFVVNKTVGNSSVYSFSQINSPSRISPAFLVVVARKAGWLAVFIKVAIKVSIVFHNKVIPNAI